MGKNKGKGGKGFKRMSKQEADDDKSSILIIKECDDQDYGYVSGVLGGGRFKVLCMSDMTERIGIVRGRMRKRVWIAAGDMVLHSYRGFQDNKVDIFHKYTREDMHKLHSMQYITDAVYNVYNRSMVSGGQAVPMEEDDNHDVGFEFDVSAI